jgi:hypothetical protein
MIRSNSKVYKFKISIGNSLDYAQKYIDKQIINCGTKIPNCNGYYGSNDYSRGIQVYNDNTIMIYDMCKNYNYKNNIINLCISKYRNNYWSYQDKTNFIGYEILQKIENTNKYIKEIYDENDIDILNIDMIYKHIYSNILNYNLINILIKNICKDFFVEYIDISLTEIYAEFNGLNRDDKITVIDTITIIIDETKQSNNRNIKIYKEFNDFYQNRDNKKNYQIIKDINNLCIIEELESIQNLLENKDLIKSPQEIIIDKDLEIEKLKKEIQELKKFYI